MKKVSQNNKKIEKKKKKKFDKDKPNLAYQVANSFRGKRADKTRRPTEENQNTRHRLGWVGQDQLFKKKGEED